VFTTSIKGDDLVSNGDPMPPQAHGLLTEAFADIRRGQLQTDCPLLRIEAHGTTPYALVWSVPDQKRRGNQPIIGVVADLSLVTDLVARILKQSPLLPPSLAGDTGDVLTVRVANHSGREIFASSSTWSQYASENVLERELGGLRLSVALRPSAADRLIIGGVPRNRVPLLVGLLILTTGLVVVALIQMRRERELVRLRADFISGVSHELRTPVSQIRMFGETLLLDRVRSAEERKRSLAIIVQESQRLTHLIENVLHFSRSDRGAPLVRPVPARLDLLLHEILDGFEPLARSKRTSIARHIEEGVVVAVDAGALRQIVLNLLDNALKYGPAGQTITVTCECERGAAVIAVEDQGPGVPVADTARIWEPFYRVANHTDSSGGTGIGLAIVKQLVDLHDGRVQVERVTSGARFTIELPGASPADVASECERPTAAGA
jgi:signal transduction histidine kinase